QTLLVVLEQDRDGVRREVMEAIESGLLVTLRSWASLDQEIYRFLHDRVQQAALSLLSEDAIKQIRLRIGRLMLASIVEIEDDERLFAIAAHLNFAGGLIVEPPERERMVQVNLAACLRAKRSTAYAIARDYASRAMGFLAAPSDAQLVMRLLLERAE